MTRLKTLFSAVLAGLLIAGLTACSGVKLDVSDVTAIVDIRPAAEFEKSHIVGAVNIDFESGSFSAQASSLIRSGKYYFYGRDEAQVSKAIDELNVMGFTSVTNVGSFEDAVRLLPLGVTP